MPLGSVLLFLVLAQANQTSVTPGPTSIPGGPATNQVLRLTLRDAIEMAVRYNLGAIESNENVHIARGQRLHALSNLMPQVGAGVNENVEQLTAASFGIKNVLVPFVLGPFSYSTAQAAIAQTRPR
jgi:hypothetical protein